MNFKSKLITAAALIAVGTAVIAAPAQAAPSYWDWSAQAKTAAPIVNNPVGPERQLEAKLGLDGKITEKVDGKVVTASRDSVTYDYRYQGTRFGGQWICQNDWTGSATPMNSTANAFESGTNPVGTVVFSYRDAPAGQLCSGYAAGQQIYSYEYNTADGGCGSVHGPYAAVADPQNPNYDSQWTGTVTIGVNVHYADCRNTVQRRNNVTSRLVGYAAGLEEFVGSASSIMNLNYQYSYNLAGGWDRNNLFFLY